MWMDAEVNQHHHAVREDEQAPPQTSKQKRPRGFAAMDRNLVREIARKGGQAAHKAGTAHQFTSEEAKEAGRKGGLAPHVRRGSHRGDAHRGSERSEQQSEYDDKND